MKRYHETLCRDRTWSFGRTAAGPAPVAALCRAGARGQNQTDSALGQRSARGGGRVKRRSPSSIEQFTVVVRDTALRRLRMSNSKSNRITCFRQSSDFSHGLDGKRSFTTPHRGDEVEPKTDLPALAPKRGSSTHSRLNPGHFDPGVNWDTPFCPQRNALVNHANRIRGALRITPASRPFCG